jgi:hypothetical protein
MSIVNRGLGLSRTLILRGLGNREIDEAVDNVFTETTITIESNIKALKRFYPLTGTFSENENVFGWKYSRSYPQDLDSIYSRIENSIGGYEYNLEEGTIRIDWKGAVLEGINLIDIKKVFYKDLTSKWVPELSRGIYSIYFLEKELYSSYSSSKLLIEEFDIEEFDNEDTGETEEELVPINEVILPYEVNNVSITCFKRDKYFVNIPWLKYKYSDIDTISDGFYYLLEKIVEQNNEYALLTVYDFFSRKIGLDKEYLIQNYDTNHELIELYEYAGIGNDSRSIVYTEYFPIIDVTLIEETVDPNDGSGSIEVWEKVSEFSFENKKEFIVDKFNGKILINKTIEKDFYLFKYLGGANVLEFHSSLEKWPLKKGKLKLGDEIFEYIDKEENFIFLKEVPVNPDMFTQGAKITFLNEGSNFGIGTNIYVGYKAVPRIDYDFDSDVRITNTDVKPYEKIDSNGILEINPYERHISKLELSCDLTEEQPNKFGTLYMGSNATKVTAKATNSHGSPVKESLVTFYADFGKFNSSNNISSSITNQNGEAFVYYNWPYSEKENSIIINNLEYIDGAHTLIRFDSTNTVISATDEINVFQILKDDPFYGSLGWQSEVTVVDYSDSEYVVFTLKENLPNLEEYFTNQMLYLEYQSLSSSEDFEAFISNHECQELLINYCLGYIKVDNNNWKFIVDKIIDKNKIAVKKEFFRNENVGLSVPGTKIQLYKRNETEFSRENVENGFSFDRIMYEDDGNKLSPIKPSYGSVLDGDNIIVYEDIILPPGSMDNPENLIAGYKIFVNRIANLYAEVVDPATGRIVRSNTIKIVTSLPEFLKGSEGFKIVEDNNNNESGLGGSNFLTINEIAAQNEYNEIVENLNQENIITVNPFYKNRINLFVENED